MNTTALNTTALDFELPKLLECGKPAEARGIARDEVRLMVSNLNTDEIEHAQFRDLPGFLEEGDVLVINTSGTLKAALEATRQDGKRLRVHLSTRLREKYWVIELRQLIDGRAERFEGGRAGEELLLDGGGRLYLLQPYYTHKKRGHLQLWEASFETAIPVTEYLDRYGAPIRYGYVKTVYPQSYYQTAFANEMGSAEMPSAGRAFTPELITRLITQGIEIVPILLHTGVASPEIGERPYEEYFRVTATAAERLDLARRSGRRIIAVGTTVVRALESAATSSGRLKAREGWTDLFISPQRGMQVVDGLLTGFHEPRASHLLMLEALAGRRHLQLVYEEAIRKKYQWHEFGDLHLMLPNS